MEQVPGPASPALGAALLRLARTAVEHRLGLTPGAVPPLPAPLPRPSGLFVTIHKHGELRGCVGTMRLETPLAVEVERLAVESAFDDPRFLPLQPDEYPALTFEVSLLSPARRVASIDAVEPGRHGVWIKKGSRSGVFLPQVWEELPDKEMFLNALCTTKAGLEERCWLEPGVEVHVFTVEKFSEDAAPSR
jgi:AmmeMemoRadiSam system protein A